MTPDIDAALTDLRALLGDRLSISAAERQHHGTSETHFANALPDAVAFPQTTAEVAELARICARHRVPMVGWGTGTSLEGQSLPVRGGISVDFRNMAKVLEVQPENMLAVVQPGVTREALNEELRATGLFFPVDPGANASLGGMASTRASGTTAVRYGTMRENVRALEVVLADGRVIRTGTAAPKSSAGYDLTALFVGSEGTLGLITELTLRLQGQPEAISAATCAFADFSGAVDTVIATIQSGIPMARIEFVDAATARAFNMYSGASMPEKPHLMIEFHGSESGVAEQAAAFGDIAAEFGAEAFQWAQRPEDRKALWAMRHNAFYATMALRPGATALVTDICVPIARLAEAVAETTSEIEKASFPGPMVGHVGDGNFHCSFLIEPGNAAELAEAKALAARMNERALRLGGTVTGEHGVGMGKMPYMQAQHGAGWDVMTRIKRALDPDNLMNPGKMVQVN
jgi:D-lactate dehydrogenase (cytochrome)